MKSFWKNKKVFITGAAGFIGSHAVDVLVERGAKVIAAISPQTSVEQIERNLYKSKQFIEINKVDLVNKKSVIDTTKNTDIILNFAAMDGGSLFKQKYPARIFNTNISIVTNILDAAVANHVGRVLLMSSIEVYPKNAKTPIQEQYSLKENFKEEATGYTWSKRFTEIAAKMYAQEYGLQIAIARAGNVYGSRDYFASERERVIPVFIEKIYNHLPIEFIDGGMQKKQFLFVRDLITAVLMLTEKYAICDPVNIAGSEVITIRELADYIKQIMEDKEMQLLKSNPKDRIISITKLQKKIKFKQKTSLRAGLQETIAYFKGNNF